MKRILLLLLFVSFGSSSATYYVRTDGNDANDGLANTSGGAWLTVQKAANTMSTGDTASVQSGTYVEKVSESTAGTLFVASGAVTLGGFAITGSNVTVQGFQFSGYGVTSFKGAVDISANNVTVRSCVITNLAVDLYGVLVDGTETGAYIDGVRFGDCNYPHLSLEGSGHTVTNCTWTGSTGWDAIRLLCSNTKIVDCVWSNFVGSSTTYETTHGDLIQTFSDGGQIATNNLVERCRSENTYYIQLLTADDVSIGSVSNWVFRNCSFTGPSMAANIYAPGFKFQNCTFSQVTTNTGHVILLRGTNLRNYADGTEIVNCIFDRCGADPSNATYGWYIEDADRALANLVTNYNLVVGTGAGTTKTGFTEANGINGEDPLLVSDVPQAGSPAIGTGTDLSAFFTDDFTGATRVAPWDIGAYEYFPTGGTTATAGTVNVGTLNIAP